MTLFSLASASMFASSMAATVNWDGRVTAINCDEPIPEFTGGSNHRYSRRSAEEFCSCIWKEVNVSGWERGALQRIQEGEDPGSIETAAVLSRFSAAVKECETGKYQLASDQPSAAISGQLERSPSISLNVQRVLGFIGGGILGIWVAPQIYIWVNGNVIIWLVVGLIAGWPLWYFSMLPIAILWTAITGGKK